MTHCAIGTDRCGWSMEDVEFFKLWLLGKPVQQWLHAAYNDLVETMNSAKPVIPESLKGLEVMAIET